MAKKTIEVHSCDGVAGSGCGRELGSIRDGVVLVGVLRAPGAETSAKPLAGEWFGAGSRSINAGQPAEVALCWECFQRATRCPETLVQPSPERTDR